MTGAEREIETFVRELAARKGNLLVVTGAGVSAGSGIPVFRQEGNPDAIWTKETTELATRRYFRKDPVGQWRWYLARFANMAEKAPNAGHRALVELERRWPGRFLLVTQNIDTLHEQAGSTRMMKVHGSSALARCSRAGCVNGAPTGTLRRADLRDAFARFEARPCVETLPVCPACGAILRAHVLWFDESYGEHEGYGFSAVRAFLPRADGAIFVGTSFSVGITALVEGALAAGSRPMFSIDPAPTSGAGDAIVHVAAKAEEFLPRLASCVE